MTGKKLFWALFLALAAGWLAASPALAFPPLPSSFFGEVKVNGQNVPDGTLVRALIGGKVYTDGRTHTYQGSSVFNLDIPGDEAGSEAVEGGREGDVIQFEIGGVLAEQTGQWHSATNVRVNLSASSDRPLNTPGPAPTPVPTQTPIGLQAQPAASQAPAAAAAVARAATAPAPVERTASAGYGSLIAGGALAVLVAGGATLALIRRKK